MHDSVLCSVHSLNLLSLPTHFWCAPFSPLVSPCPPVSVWLQMFTEHLSLAKCGFTSFNPADTAEQPLARPHPTREAAFFPLLPL